MKATENRKNKAGQLIGPKAMDKWQEWRRARNRAIENPRRLKTCKDVNGEQSPDASEGSP